VNAPPGKQHARPLWLAAFLTAILTPVLYLLGFTLIALVGGEFSSELAFRSLGFMFLFGLLPALGAMYFVGLPLVMLLRSQRLLTSWYVLAGAVAVGILTMAVLVTVIMKSPFEPLVLVWGAGLGAFAGVIFCISAGIPFRERRT
jgi:hypothetical protein